MILERLEVRNFRSLRNLVVDFGNVTVLVGSNGAGKSAIFRALQTFYEPAISLSQDDFFNRDITRPIELAATFGGLSATEKGTLGPYVQSGRLRIEEVVTWTGDTTEQAYYGVRPQADDFAKVRGLSKAGEQKELYEKIRQLPDYRDLQPWTNQKTSLEALAAWEATHPDRCSPVRDNGAYFSFRDLGQVNLKRFTRFVLIKAGEDPSLQGSEGKATALTQLMNLIVRQSLRERKDFGTLQEEMKTKTRELLDTAQKEELAALETELSTILGEFASGAGVKLEWSWEDLEIPMPRASVRLTEHEYTAPIGSTGHGLQRLFMITLLRRLATFGAGTTQPAAPPQEPSEEAAPELPSLIIGIEEPELFQHPNRQRSLAQTLRRLAGKEIPGVAKSIQVAYSTHSPLFVTMDQFENVRLVRKARATHGDPMITSISQASIDQLTREMERIWQKPSGTFTSEVTREKMSLLMTPEVSEGFFANVAVLVEGPRDRALIVGYATAHQVPLEPLGISVIPCAGKENIARPAVVFGKLGIPTYLVWDNDRSKAMPEENRRLLRLLGVLETDFPAAIEAKHAAFDETLESSVETEIGTAAYGRLLSSQAAKFDNAPVEPLKTNPVFYEGLFRRVREQGIECRSLGRLMTMIQGLAQ